MRTFENKETELENEKGTMTYSDLAKICTDHMPKEGFTTTIMKKRLDVESMLSDVKAGESVDIEENVYETLTECVTGFAWGRMHKDIVAFEDYITGMEKHKK